MRKKCEPISSNVWKKKKMHKPQEWVLSKMSNQNGVEKWSPKPSSNPKKCFPSIMPLIFTKMLFRTTK